MNKPTEPPYTPEEIADAIWEQCRIFWMENPDLSKEEIINQIAAAIRDAAVIKLPKEKEYEFEEDTK